MKIGRLRTILLKSWHPYAWLFAAGWLLYFRTVFFDYTYLDDNALILGDQEFLNNFLNIFSAFSRDAFGANGSGADVYYRPLQTVFFIIGAHISGAKLYAYHVVNILVHLISAMLVYRLFMRLNWRPVLAFLFSFIFLIHPILTQAVAWVPGLNDSLLTLFGLASFIYLVDIASFEAKANDATLEGKEAQYLYHLLFLLLALFSKESAVIFIILFFLYLLLIKRDRLFSFCQQVLLFGYMVIVVAWFLLRRAALDTPLEIGFVGPLKSVLANLPVLIQYAGKAIFPFNLSVLSTIKDTTFICGAVAAVLAAVLLTMSKNKRWNYIIFGLCWFVLLLIPTLAFHNPGLDYGYDYHLDHRMHAAIIGLIIIIHEVDLVKFLSFRSIGNMIAIGACLISLALLTGLHSENYSNRLAFWQNAANKSPHSPLAQRNLGAMYYLDGKLDEAAIRYQKALEINPNEEMAHGNLGLIYASRNEDRKAEEEYKKEIEINPSYDHVHFNLGLLYYKQGKKKEAEGEWLETIRINPGYSSAYINLAVLYREQNETVKAEQVLRQMNAR